MSSKENDRTRMYRMHVKEHWRVYGPSGEKRRNALLFFMRRLQARMGNHKKITDTPYMIPTEIAKLQAK